MSLTNLRVMLGVVAWGLVLFSTLSLARLRGDWGHSICGPWGCGPPVQAIFSCHLSWFVVLIPPVVMSQSYLTNRQLRITGLVACACGSLGIWTVVIYEICIWWVAAIEIHRNFLWQRLLFSIVTHVDLPLIELIIAGAFLLIRALSVPTTDRLSHRLGRSTFML